MTDPLTMAMGGLAFFFRPSTRLFLVLGVIDLKQLAPNLSEERKHGHLVRFTNSIVFLKDESHDTHWEFIEAHNCIISSTLQLKLYKCVVWLS